MTKITLGHSGLVSLLATAAHASSVTPIPEPGMLGLLAGSVIALVALIRLRGR